MHAAPELYQVLAVREKIGLLHDHSKTGSFSFRSRFCPFEFKIHIMYRYFYQVPAKKFILIFGIVFRIPKSTSINSAFDTLDLQRRLQILSVRLSTFGRHPKTSGFDHGFDVAEGRI